MNSRYMSVLYFHLGDRRDTEIIVVWDHEIPNVVTGPYTKVSEKVNRSHCYSLKSLLCVGYGFGVLVSTFRVVQQGGFLGTRFLQSPVTECLSVVRLREKRF